MSERVSGKARCSAGPAGLLLVVEQQQQSRGNTSSYVFTVRVREFSQYTGGRASPEEWDAAVEVHATGTAKGQWLGRVKWAWAWNKLMPRRSKYLSSTILALVMAIWGRLSESSDFEGDMLEVRLMCRLCTIQQPTCLSEGIQAEAISTLWHSR